MHGLRIMRICAIAFGALFATALAAEEAAAAAPIDTGDTAWVLTSAALVLFMTPGLAFFYGGLVRRKNFLSVLMQCFMAMCLVCMQWAIFGYSLSFGPDIRGVIGSLDWAFLRSVTNAPHPDYGATIPHTAFMAFQMMFAIITPALIIGAFAERMRFSAYCLFILLWAALVYDPVAHWVWGVGGFLRDKGALDFAGGTVVHINAGMAALAIALPMGKRVGSLSPPHNLPFAALGVGLLWFGWLGFNAGSALGANGLAANAFVVTNVAAATAAAMWAVCDWLYHKKPTTLGMISGAVAGLVAITPAAGYVGPMSAIGIGAIAGILCFLAVTVVKTRLAYDDALDAFGVHGVGGIWGSIATGLWANKAINAGGADGLFAGNARQLLVQLEATAITAAFAFAASWVIFKVVDALIGMRVTPHEERVGLDLTQHREAAYTVID